MSAPWQSVAALAWGIVGPPLLVYGATRIGAGQKQRHQRLMIAWIVLEFLAILAFASASQATPRRAELVALPFFKIHLVFSIAALAGIVWQVVSRVVARWQPAHRLGGPYVVMVWCLALLTGIYNFVFVYVLAP